MCVFGVRMVLRMHSLLWQLIFQSKQWDFMNHTNGWMDGMNRWMSGGNGWLGGGMWLWTVIGVLLVVFLVVAIGKLSKQ